jgi:hypothetical protein
MDCRKFLGLEGAWKTVSIMNRWDGRHAQQCFVAQVLSLRSARLMTPAKVKAQQTKVRGLSEIGRREVHDRFWGLGLWLYGLPAVDGKTGLGSFKSGGLGWRLLSVTLLYRTAPEILCRCFGGR